ncbi:RNA recognition motif domain-containing protein [Thalassoglobus polymorphus]|uniref:RNA recognition motif (RRM, RBD, or RNP domain) n=1 Tax=Thalassoglobus polymorphus TaxID=2527994 RepID=A0A517QUF0_9PLAN|nr:RNA-binding protein [Thalassoglobus polymorphus]QDT35270.1 RNA recognition motif (RRM, RBD, or RNP domain) [Thalassoglobus polymorphus]
MTSIFVGNLSYEATDSDLRSVFENYGHVSAVQMMTDRTTGKSRGFAFVRMPNMEDAEEAIARLNGASVCGRAISVNEANERENRREPGMSLPKAPNIFDLLEADAAV